MRQNAFAARVRGSIRPGHRYRSLQSSLIGPYLSVRELTGSNVRYPEMLGISGASIPMGQDTSPQYLVWGDMITNAPLPPIFLE